MSRDATKRNCRTLPIGFFLAEKEIVSIWRKPMPERSRDIPAGENDPRTSASGKAGDNRCYLEVADTTVDTAGTAATVSGSSVVGRTPSEARARMASHRSPKS